MLRLKVAHQPRFHGLRGTLKSFEKIDRDYTISILESEEQYLIAEKKSLKRFKIGLSCFYIALYVACGLLYFSSGGSLIIFAMPTITLIGYSPMVIGTIKLYNKTIKTSEDKIAEILYKEL